MTHSPRARRSSDADGAAVVHVRMSNDPSAFATFDADDYDRLRRLYPGPWRLNSNGLGAIYVRAVAPGTPYRNVNLAREALQPGHGRIVRYRDGDRLNLRRANLYVEEGTTHRRTTPTEQAARDSARRGSVSRKLSPRALQAALS